MTDIQMTGTYKGHKVEFNSERFSCKDLELYHEDITKLLKAIDRAEKVEFKRMTALHKGGSYRGAEWSEVEITSVSGTTTTSTEASAQSLPPRIEQMRSFIASSPIFSYCGVIPSYPQA